MRVAPHRRWVFVSFASLLVYTFGIFLKPLAEEFEWSRAASAAFGIAAMTVAVAPPAGYLLDRVSPRRILVPCMAVFGCAFASLALLTPHIWHLYATFFIMGVVGNGTAQMAYSRAVSSWFVKRRGMALAVVMSGGAIGAMVLPPVPAALTERVGWRAPFAALGGMVLAIGLPCGCQLHPRTAFQRAWTPGSQSTAEGDGPRGGQIAAVLDCRDRALPRLDRTKRRADASAGHAHRPRHLAGPAPRGDARRNGRREPGWPVPDRLAARPFLRASRGVVAAVGRAVGTLLLSSAHSFAAGLLASILIGLGMGGEADVTPYILSRYYGLRSFAMLYGFTWTAYAVAGAIGPVLMGWVFDATASYQTLLLVLGAGTFGAAALMQLMPPYGAPPFGRNVERRRKT